MEVKQAIARAKEIKKGAFVSVEYYGNPKKLKSAENVEIIKKCKGVYRLGLTYANLKINANKETGGLNGVEWVSGLENYELTNAKGEEMIRLYTTKCKTHSQWFINGIETTKTKLVNMGLISKSEPSQAVPPCINVKIKNLIRIG